MAKRTYQMWALFNYNRPPIFVETTRRECVVQGIDWLGDEKRFKKERRSGSITIEKIVLRRIDGGGAGKGEETTCDACKGAGTVKAMTQQHGPDDYEVDVECPTCGGSGAIAKKILGQS